MDDVIANIQDYPECDVPFPVQTMLRTASTTEGASYTQEANAESFNENVSTGGMPSSTVIDADNVDATYKARKLDALEHLKGGSPFIKYPTGSVPLPTRHNPQVYGHLWPTLFPYGVGMMQNDSVRENDSIGFRKIDMKTHVAHFLQSGSDRRFQTHMAFIFVIHNIML
jgi:hypothetical protein